MGFLPSDDPLAAFLGGAGLDVGTAPRSIEEEHFSEQSSTTPGAHGDEAHDVLYARKATLTAHVISAHPVPILKSVDEMVNNSATLQDDDELALPVAADEVWSFELILFFKSSATADLKIGWSVPAGASMLWQELDALSVAALIESGTLLVDGLGASTTAITVIRGVIVVGSAGGFVQLQWAQNSAEVSDTVIEANSHLIGTRLA